jgi:hypothetical protein
VLHNLAHPPVRLVRAILLPDHPARGGQDGAHDRGVPEEVATEHLRVEQTVVDE